MVNFNLNSNSHIIYIVPFKMRILQFLLTLLFLLLNIGFKNSPTVMIGQIVQTDEEITSMD